MTQILIRWKGGEDFLGEKGDMGEGRMWVNYSEAAYIYDAVVHAGCIYIIHNIYTNVYAWFSLLYELIGKLFHSKDEKTKVQNVKWPCWGYRVARGWTGTKMQAFQFWLQSPFLCATLHRFLSFHNLGQSGYRVKRSRKGGIGGKLARESRRPGCGGLEARKWVMLNECHLTGGLRLPWAKGLRWK